MLNFRQFFSISVACVFVSLNLFGQGGIITTIAGTGTAGFSGDWGPPTAAQLNSPVSLTFGGSGSFGSLYVADGTNNRVRQIKLGGGGIIFTIAGTGSIGFSGDGGPATACVMNVASGIAATPHDIVYFSDHFNHRIRKIDYYGTVTTYGGTGVAGYNGDNIPATTAQTNQPYDISMDKYGNIYFAEEYGHRMRKIDTNGIMTTVAGIGVHGYSGDGGPATNAMISYPNFSYVDTFGQIYISDNGNFVIRKVDTNGTISTVAGNGTLGFSGDGGQATNAQLQYPADIVVDKNGDLIICDSYNDRMRKVDKNTGIIHTFAGTGVAGFSGDGGPASAAMLNKPHGLAIDYYNNIYFTDRFNNKVRMITADSTLLVQQEKARVATLVIYPNPSYGNINIAWTNLNAKHADILIQDMLGRSLYQSGVTLDSKNGKLELTLPNLQTGIYKLTIGTPSELFNETISIMK